jgi:hypothetical protein
MRQHEKGGRQHEMPVQHKLNAFPDELNRRGWNRRRQ